MKFLVTGASGFLGRHVVAEGLRRGHAVRAMVRPGRDPSRLPWRDHPGLELIRHDLRSRTGLASALGGVDAVLHLAARLAGDFYDQFQDTVIATENLLDALAASGAKPRLVHVSTFSVYGCLQRWSWSSIDERSPLEKHLRSRDDYAITKFVQEQLVRSWAEAHGWPLAVLRPGVIYGRQRPFCAQLGLRPSARWWIRIGSLAPVPLTYVENCAGAVILCAERPEAIAGTFNVVDDSPPAQRRLVNLIRARLEPRPAVLPVPWIAVRCAARAAWTANRVLLGGRAKLPGLLVPVRVHALFKPFRYTNRLLRERVGWAPRISLAEALERTFGAADTAVLEDDRRADGAEMRGGRSRGNGNGPAMVRDLR